MSVNWPLQPLSDFINIKHGFAFKGEFFCSKKTSDYLVTPGNFAIGGGFKTDKFKYYDGPVPDDYVLKEGDLVVTMTDLSKEADTLGYSAIIPLIDGHRLLHNQRVGLVELKNNELDKTFLYFLLRSKGYRNHVLSGITGTTVKHTSPTKVLSYEFRVPPFDVQVEIGKSLIAIERKIDLNRETNQTLENISQAIFKSWFVDFEPTQAKVIAKNKGQDPERAAMAAIAGLSTVFHEEQATDADQLNTLSPEQLETLKSTAAHFPENLVNSELGEIPDGWETSTLGSHFDVIMGQSPKGDTYNEKGNGMLFFQGRRDFRFRFPTPRVYTTDPKRVAQAGDTLISVRAPVGDRNMAAVECCLGRGVASIRHKSGARSFTYAFIGHIENSLSDNGSDGTVFSSINKKELGAIDFVAPNNLLINLFESKISSIDQKIEMSSLEIDSLEELRNTLLPKLLSGELEVTHAN